MRKYNFSGKNSAQSSAVAPLYITKQQKEQNVGGFLGGIGYLGEKLATGFFQSLEGISDYTLGGFAKLFGADDWAEEQFENDWFGDWYTHPDEWYNPSEGWKVAGDVAGGIGTSLPSLAAGATAAGITILSGGTAAPLAAGLASAATAGLGAAGTGTKEAYKKTGQLGGKEFAYGALSGLVEGTTEGVTNALTLGTGTVLKNIAKSFGKEITQTVAKQSAVKGLLGGFLGEAFEEGLSEWVNPYIARITYDADAENATAQEIFYSALIGGLSGMVMEGVNIAADTGNSFAKGAKIANSGREGEVLGLSQKLATFQNENATENEAFRAVADTYKTLSESLALTGGKITTAAQKKQLGDLSRANVSAVFSPMITRSAANIYANAEAIADALGTYGYKDADGKPMNFTAEQIREGIDPTNKKSLARALKTNTVLRTLAVADVTGQMMMDTQKFRDATLAGKNLARRADLWRFAEEATPDEIRSVSEALGIDNWETLTEDDFADKITTFLRDGGAKRYADLRAESERIFADESEAAALPTLIALEDGQTRKYKTGEDTVAIARKGEGYRIFDYGTRQTSREMSRAEVNKALADNNLRGQAISARMQEYAEKTAEIKRKTQETDTWARENTKGYAELSAPNKTMIRKVIRSAKENGIADEDIKTYSSVSAHSGVDIVFSKRLTKADGGYADAFYDPKKNRIVVNPEATRSAEKILLHELDHAIRTGIRKDGGTKLFADALFGISDEAMEKITARYKDMESDVSTDELIADEANAYFAETVFADKKVLEQLTEKVPTLKERIISFLEGAVTSYAGEPKLEGAAKRYLKQYKKMFAEFAERNVGNNAEEARRLGKIGDARFSLQFADDIATDQRKFVIDGKAALTQEELELAIEQTAEMVAIMSEHKDILPEDKTGKTLVKNGSYDYSVENTTICVRTLAYNSFTDMVSEKIGRPLSQMESFLVSQKLYEIAKEPQCLYCYVSLDRKAYNEMILRYITQRDEAIADYISAGKPKVTESSEIYKKFLAGRKPTPQMWSRYKAWTELAANGEYIVNAGDVATEAKRADLARKNDGRAAQVKDMLKYAQSASWAKKQTQYVAYFDDIRKLSPAVIKNLNKHYGLRWYSFSDYSGAFIVENMQQVTDAALRGLKGLAYTKDTDYARIFAPTGMNINISVYAKKTENGYAIDEKQSANIEEAIELRKQFPNVGIVVVATDADGVEWALDQKWSDVVIPFHTVRTGADVADFYKWEIFNTEQNDTVSDENLWNAYVQSVSGGNARAAKKVSKMIYPSEHQNNRETYMRLLQERGLTPRFKSFLGNPNYMKLVNETRQSEADTKPLTATYDLDAAKKSFDKFVKKGGYFEGWYNDGIDVDNEASIVASDIAAGRKANEVEYGRQDITMPDRRKVREHGRRYALPLDEDALAAVDALLESEDIKPASVIDRFVPTADGSKRMERYSRADAMKTISKFPHIDALSDAKYKQLITAMYDGMSKAETMDAKIDFARGFAQAFITDLTDARETRSDYSEAVETKQKLAVGLQKLTFSKEDINELMHLLGEDEARAFMNRWERKKTNVKYPIDVFLGDIQTAAPEFTSNIDGKAPVDALIEIDRIYTDAKERAKSKYVYPYREMTDTERAMLENKVFKGIMTGFAAADKEITAQAMKGAAEEATYFQAKLEEQTATDREFREAQQAEFDKKAKNLNERNRENKEYYGTQTKLAKIAQKGAEVTAKEAKKQAETAKKAQANAEERAAKAEARAEKQIEAEEARADRVIEAYEKKAAKAVERAEKAEDAYREMRGGERYRGYIANRVEKLREMKKGTYSNSAFLKDDTFDKIISKLISVEWRKDFSTSGTKQAFKELLKWYDPENEIIGTNFDADLQAQISDIAVTEKKEYSAEDLKSIDEILGYFTKFIEHFNKVYINGKWVEAKPVAEGYITKLKSGAKIKEGIFRNLRQKYFTSFGDAASVMRYFDRYQKGGFFTDIFEMMRAAAIKADTEEMRLMRDYEAFMKENPKYLAEAEKTEIEFAGVKIPKMTAISLLMTMKREQARKGFAIGGFKFIDAKGEAVKVKGFATDTEISSDADMQAIEFEKLITGRLTELEGKMTDTDRAYMKVLEKVYNEDARNLKAERDKEKYGFTNVLDDYYYPIRRANSAKSVDTAYSAELDRVSSASFNKDIVKGAAGKLFIQNADVLFRNHVKAVCQYATLSPVIEAYNKLYNMDIGGNPNDPVSVKEESENLWAGANEYFRNLIGDIQGVPRTRGEGTEILSYIRGGYAKFQLGANPKTWASQLSSAFAATSILDIDSMAKATGISGKDVDKYCAIAELRNAENTAAMAQGVMTPGKRIRTKLDKVSDVLMKPIGWVDRGVVRRLFAVCQVQVQKNGGAKIGTEANKVEAGKLLERVILETQQNSFATEKSAAMRSGNEILKTFTMFSADGMKMIGRVMDGFGEVSAIKARLKGADKATKEAAKAELAAAGKKLGRSVGAMALSSLHMALVAQFFRHLYDKEEDDDTVLAVTWDMALDFGGGMLGGLPIFRDVYTRFTDGFGVENCTLETFNALMDSTAGIVTLTTKAMQGKATTQETARAVKNVIYSACQFGGIPVRNVMNFAGGITKRFSPEAAYTVDGWFYEKNYQNDLWRAVEDGDDRMVNMLVTLAVNDKTGSTLTEAAHTELRRLISAGYNALPREVGKTITVDGTEYAMSEEEREMVREAYATATDKLDKLFANRTYSRLTDEEKTEAIRYVYNTAYNAALTDVYGIERGNAAIIAETVGYDTAATLYIRTKGIESDKGKDGKTISGTKRKKTVAAINSMPISTEKKLFLICAKGYALSDGDVRGLSAEAAKKRLLRYIVNLPGKTKNEKAMLAEMCGFAVKNGKISLKNSA